MYENLTMFQHDLDLLHVLIDAHVNTVFRIIWFVGILWCSFRVMVGELTSSTNGSQTVTTAFPTLYLYILQLVLTASNSPAAILEIAQIHFHFNF